MRIALARIRLKTTEEGGGSLPIGQGYDYRCHVYFNDVAALSAHAYECRLLLRRIGKTMKPGDTLDDVPLAFLSPKEVFLHLRIGVTLQIWESREIGEAVITAIPEDEVDF